MCPVDAPDSADGRPEDQLMWGQRWENVEG